MHNIGILGIKANYTEDFYSKDSKDFLFLAILSISTSSFHSANSVT